MSLTIKNMRKSIFEYRQAKYQINVTESKEKTLELDLRVGHKKAIIEVTFSKTPDKIEIHDYLSAGDICLASCAIVALKKVLDCWRDSKGDWNRFVSCLRSKKGEIGIEALNCIINHCA